MCRPEQNRGATRQQHAASQHHMAWAASPANPFATRRSRLEETYEALFERMGFTPKYEPCVFDISPDKDGQKHYTPDFWLPEIGCFIEIKGPLPTDEELHKCQCVCDAGFPIVLVSGNADAPSFFSWARPRQKVCGRRAPAWWVHT